jgi:hypothetical protein
MNLTGRSSNHAVFPLLCIPGASTSDNFVHWIHARIPLLQQHRHTGRNESTTELRLLLFTEFTFFLQRDNLNNNQRYKNTQSPPGIAVAAPSVAGAEVCASEEADAGVGVASAVSTASAFMPRKLYVPDRIYLVDV